MNDFMRRVRARGRLPSLGSRLGAHLAPALAVAVTAGVLAFSFTSIEPGQVAVRVNYLTGTQDVITEPVMFLRMPLVHGVYVLDASPQTFSMKGTDNRDALNVEALTVRASDGSNFHFDEFILVFQLGTDQAVAALRDGGTEQGHLQWMRPYARAVLRDEFGRESTIDVSDPTKYGQAAERAKNRLNEVLAPHGVIVTQVVTPRPKFNEGYEAAIEERNALGNELEVIRSDLARASTDRDRQLAEVDQAQNRIIQEKRAELESALATATAEQASVKREADGHRIGRIAEGQAALSGAAQRARELEGELVAKLQASRAQIEAFRSQPVERVMARLAERLAGVTVGIQPYADDATPSRVKLEQDGGGK